MRIWLAKLVWFNKIREERIELLMACFYLFDFFFELLMACIYLTFSFEAPIFLATLTLLLGCLAHLVAFTSALNFVLNTTWNDFQFTSNLNPTVCWGRGVVLQNLGFWFYFYNVIWIRQLSLFYFFERRFINLKCVISRFGDLRVETFSLPSWSNISLVYIYSCQIKLLIIVLNCF